LEEGGEVKATFIDCWINNNSVILWVKINGKNLRLTDYFTPNIYIKGSNLKELKEKLFNNGIKSFFAKKKDFYSDEVWALRVPVYKISNYHSIIREIESSENYNVELYNADLKLEELYMFEKDLFPTAEIDIEYDNKSQVKSIHNLDDPFLLDYKIPKFRIANIQVKTTESLYKTYDTKIKSIKFNKTSLKGEEKAILKEFKELFESNDPDVLWTENGNLILPFLKEKFNTYEISFNFNRFDPDEVEKKEGKTYWAYASVYYRAHSVFLKGRLHFDTKSFFSDDTGFYGIIEGSRVCRNRIQRIEMRSAGAAVTNLLLYESYKRNFLLPFRVGMYERFKTLGQLYQADRGSIIFEPVIGFHGGVVEFDFTSLYPQIMWKYNLSPETLFCKCCKHNKVPGLHYNFCTKKRGVVSIVAQNLIERRIRLKDLGTSQAKEKSSYLKWLLVTMFGYQAFKNKKIGTIEIHESIQAYAREILLETVRIAESLGWTVVHGIVDSLYLKKEGYSDNELKILKQEITKQTSFHLKLDGEYNWMVFLPSICNTNRPVPNHFYGVEKKGELKCRGIEIRRKDMPKIVVDMQKEMIGKLSSAKTLEEFTSLFPQVYEILKNYIKILDSPSIDKLKILRRISKLDYKSNIPQKIVLKKLKEQGWTINPGQTISYVIKDVKNKEIDLRYESTESFKGEFDKEKYKEILIRATYSLLQPFGVNELNINEEVKGERQKKLF
jgi:DNA polymerase II